MNGKSLHINDGKKAIVRAGGKNYYCYAIKTRVVAYGDTLNEIVRDYARPVLENGDLLFISEKMVACIQGRAVPMPSIKARPLARFLSGFVTKSAAGIGLAMPETMQCAINECGTVRILAASAAGLLGKICGKKGWFYRVSGYRAACIDGPCHNTIPPYNRHVVLAPLYPEKTAADISAILGGATVLIVDINDFGVRILGCSQSVDRNAISLLLRQNPLGQSCESTPMGILRPITA